MSTQKNVKFQLYYRFPKMEIDFYKNCLPKNWIHRSTTC